jgi:DNA mismatch repair protein MutL
MNRIQALDQRTILTLAAGEIIDRPVSIVKELIENALDANATAIAIHIKQGGIAEIVVHDNGDGISNDDMPRAVAPHATSKLQTIDDLASVLTMGFRGEALASMAAVSDVTIESFNGNDELGAELIQRAGDMPQISPKACSKGTRITVAHLFKKVPVRFRFLKSPTSEANLIHRLVQQFGFHYPDRDFSLTHNGVDIISTTGVHDLLGQFIRGLSLTQASVASFQQQTKDITVSGVVTLPNKTFKQRTKCWFSVNGRMVRSPMFLKAVDAAFIDAIPRGTYPAIVCHIDCPTPDVDINIHPKKEDVKFTHPDDVFVAIKRAVGRALRQSAPSWEQAQAAVQPLSLSTGPDARPAPSFSVDSPSVVPPVTSSPVASTGTAIPAAIRTELSTPLPASDPPLPPSQTRHQMSLLPKNESFKPSNQWVYLNNKYIVVPMGSTLFLFDQHAVHERVLYDQFKHACQDNSVVSMPLLIPEYISLSPEHKEQWDTLIPLCRAMGIDIDVFDDHQLIIREVPKFFSSISVGDWLGEWATLDDWPAFLAAANDHQIRLLQMKACKAAVKSGQRLHDAEINALIESVIQSDQQYTCPHGRPLYITLSEAQLDTLFLRS